VKATVAGRISEQSERCGSDYQTTSRAYSLDRPEVWIVGLVVT